MKALSIFPDKFRLYADSSAHRNYHPAFLPDTDGGWTALVCPYVRISRLGMNISQKFASRYYDSVGGACIFVPTTHKDDIASLDERYFAMDSAFTAGECIAPTPEITLSAFGRELPVDLTALGIDSTISGLSRYMTFRMGDILMFPTCSLSVPVIEGDHLTASISGLLCIDIKIK